MTSLPIDAIFNGIDDDELETVDLPLAYLRFLSSLPVPGVGWLDSNYNQDQISSNQQAILEDGLARVTAGANQMYDTNRIAQLYSLTAMLPGLVAFWPGYKTAGGLVADIGPDSIHLTPSGATSYQQSNGLPVILSFSGGTSGWQTTSSALDILGTDGDMSNPGLTLLAWVDVGTSTSVKHVVNRWPSGSGYVLYRPSGEHRMHFRVNGLDIAASSPPPDGMVHMVATWEPGYRVRIFCNGELAGESLSFVPTSIPTQ